ncbi:UbiA family prenyltransferase [Variovorax sp. J22R24]|uniref:UbiA family prenyltransferase n=1 Tax=Variovorax gracilis TaxID=3053502 RepID=UPI00257872C4|nr:UbiA family prenyltransferase [Variovorax sp. J22R24]MDM0107896.1 UbiA family prenyltransferase [Variovorax sp. J22R24]
MANTRALYVDLDGTLIAADVLHESLFKLPRVAPWALLKLPLWVARGKAVLKRELADRVDIDVTTLPYRPEVLAMIQAARDKGRRVVLATASDEKFAHEIARHLDLFDAVLASDGDRNLSGAAKLDAIKVDAGGEPFDYIGDQPVDLPIWREADEAVVVGSTGRLAARAARHTPATTHLEIPSVAFHRYLYGVRLHQWLKNLLIFLPLLPVLHELDASLIGNACIAFLAFGLMASSIYVLNDLLDLESDRRHKRKKFRPFASGEISIADGMQMSVSLATTSLLISVLALPWQFMAMLTLYLALTLAYSFFLKRRALVDVFALAGLYTVRVGAGAAAAGLPLSYWMLSFSIFLFLSLALAKRYVELMGTQEEIDRMSRERGYHAVDMPFVLCAGIAAGQMAALLLSLYFHDQDMMLRYSEPQLLWTLVPVFLFWVLRIWLKAVRGALHDDPVVFAARDWVSQLTVCIAAIVLWAAG